RHSHRLAGELERVADERGRLLHASEARFGSLVENLPAVTYTAAYDTGVVASEITYVSPQIHDLLGSEPSAGAPVSWFEAIHPDDRDRVAEAALAARATLEPLRLEYRVERSDGALVWVQDDCSTVCAENGTPLYVQGFLVDI